MTRKQSLKEPMVIFYTLHYKQLQNNILSGTKIWIAQYNRTEDENKIYCSSFIVREKHTMENILSITTIFYSLIIYLFTGHKRLWSLKKVFFVQIDFAESEFVL